MQSFYGWKNAVILSVVYMVTIGIVFYGYAVIFPTMIKATGWGRAEASLAQTINSLFMGLLTPLSAILISRYGCKKIITSGLAIMVVCLALLGTVVTVLWHWLLVWGFCMPLGVALGGILPVQVTINYWFNIKRARVLGFVFTGGALGGFLAQPTFTWLMEQTGTWRSAWLTGCGLAVIALCLSFRVRNKPEDLGQYSDGIAPHEVNGAGSPGRTVARTYRTAVDWSLKEALRTRTVWFIMVLMLAQMTTVTFITAHGVLHLTDLHYSSMQAASVLGIIILGSGLGKFSMGWLGDIIEPRWIIAAAIFLMLASFIGLWQAPNLTLLMATGLVYGVSYGAFIVMFTVILANYFGPDSFAGINGFIMPFMIIFSAGVPYEAGHIFERFGSYDVVFAALSLLLFIGLICVVMLAPPIKTQVTESI